MSIFGYKAFNPDGTNIAGKLFTPGVEYTCDGKAKFGLQGNGYHFAKRLEDTIRYTSCENGILKEPIIAYVEGSGDIVEGEDYYYGYEELYSCTKLKVIKYLTREEILEYALNLSDLRLIRFLSQYKLKEEEILLFEGKQFYADLAIDYYQRDIKEAYDTDYKANKMLIKTNYGVKGNK